MDHCLEMFAGATLFKGQSAPKQVPWTEKCLFSLKHNNDVVLHTYSHETMHTQVSRGRNLLARAQRKPKYCQTKETQFKNAGENFPNKVAFEVVLTDHGHGHCFNSELRSSRGHS